MPLTKAGSILGPIATILGYIMDVLFKFTSQFGVFNVGLCIILFTVVMKVLMIPLTIKQQKTTKLMSIMNPEIQAIQKKYKGKTDNASMQKQNVEIQAVYEKYGTNMTSGCLPLVIQLPILFALYRVIWNIPAYVPSVRVYFDNVVLPLMNEPGYADAIQNITGAANTIKGIKNFDVASTNNMVDLLYKFTTAQWAELEAAFPAISGVIAENSAIIERMNTFLGLNMMNVPLNGFKPNIAWIIPILSGFSQWVSTKLMSGQSQKKNQDMDNPMAQSMQTMMVTMPLFSAFICFTMPIGLGIYWITTSVVTIIQQLIINSYMDKIDIDQMVKKNIEKMNKKREKKGLPPAKISQNATASLKTIKEEEEREKAAEEEKKEKIAKQIAESSSYYNKNAKPGSLAAKAQMVKQYNEAHEKKK